MHRWTAVVALAVVFLATAPGAAACLPYTFDDADWGLERGIRSAFIGTVVEEEVRDSALHAVTIRVDEPVAGTPGSWLRVTQDGGCDKIWYRQGDRLMVAIPRFDPMVVGVLEELGSELTNYQVAVWRLDGDRVATTGDIRSPRVAGVTFTTLAALRAAIAGLPDTATQRATGISNLAALVAGFALLGLGLALAGSRLGIGRRRG